MSEDTQIDVTGHYTVDEAARESGYVSGYIRQLLAEGEVDGIKRGGRWWLTPGAVTALVRRREQERRGPKN